MKTIVAAIDFSDVTDKLLETAQEFAQDLGARIKLFHLAPSSDPWVTGAVEMSAAGMTQTVGYAESEAKRRTRVMEGYRAALSAAGLEATVQLSRGSTPSDVCDELAALQPDLVVIGSHRHGMLHDLVLGGVCPKVVRRAHCPVLVVHPDDPVPHREASKTAQQPMAGDAGR